MIRLEALTSDGLERFGDLLGRSDFGGCFCAVWTHFGPDWGQRCADPARPNLAHTAADVRAGRSPGFFVWDDDALVGWTGAGSWSDFPDLDRRPASRGVPVEARDWVIGCLALVQEARGRGLAHAVLDALIAEASRNGAVSIDAFPTRPWDEPRSYRGSERLYAAHGFTVAGQDGDTLWMRRVRR